MGEMRMKHTYLTILAAGLATLVCANENQTKVPQTETTTSKESETMQILIESSLGDIVAELYPEKAPLTVSNMLNYIDAKFYDDTIFHRVIDGFMIQGGGFTKEMVQKKTEPPVQNEADNGLSNTRGTLAMARTAIVDSATSQFFINLVDRNTFLNHTAKTDRGWGYCVFGKVVSGMEVVDKIAKVATGSVGRFQDVPETPVIIKRIRRYERSADSGE